MLAPAAAEVLADSCMHVGPTLRQRCSHRTPCLQRGVEALAEAWMTEFDGKPSNVKVTILYPGG